jgi:hypothetical protein
MQLACGFRRSIADVRAAIVNLVSIERLIAEPMTRGDQASRITAT